MADVCSSRLQGFPVLVTGAQGAIGNAVSCTLRTQGALVSGMDLVPLVESDSGLFHGYYVSDVREKRNLEKAISDVEVVIHLAAWVHRLPKTREDVSMLYDLNVGATKTICGLCEKAKKRVVFASTVAVYGEEVEGQLNEDSAISPRTPYAKSKLEAEHIVLSIGGVVLRLPMVYGAGDRGNMARMIMAIKKGFFVVPGRGDALHTFVGRWNVARAVLCVISKEAARGRTFLVTDDENIKLGELCDLISDLCGRSRALRVPSALVAGAALLGSGLKRLTLVSVPMEWSSYVKLTRNLTFDGSRIRQELGYRPAKTLRDGLKEEVDWLLNPSLKTV
jgi:UDP-glucose 4-epimerase